MIFGLPVHPLIIHAVVVLLPLSALGMLAIMAIARWRRSFGPLVVLGALISAGAAFVAKETGEDLQAFKSVPHLHETYGSITAYLAAAFALVAVVWLLAERPWGRKIGDLSSTPFALITGWIATGLGVAAIVTTVLAGHSGATSVWGNLEAGTASTDKPKQQTQVEPTTKLTLEDVAAHADANSCWSAIDGKVYDLTTWISNHPGGDKAIRALCGKDGTAAFQEEHGNNAEAKQRLASLLKGELAG